MLLHWLVTAGRSSDFTFLVAFNQLLPPLIGLEEEIIALHNVSILGTQVLASFKELTPAAIYNLIVFAHHSFLKEEFAWA